MTASRVPTASREVVLPQRRQKLSRKAFAQLMLDQAGRCWACGEKLTADGIIDEHLIPLDQGGTNAFENRALFCEGCAREKTLGDISRSAKGRRIRGESGQKRRRRMRRAGLLRPSFATNRDGLWKKKMDGTVVPRTVKKGGRGLLRWRRDHPWTY